MSKLRGLSRVLSTANKVRHEEGMGGLVSAVWKRAELSMRLFALVNTQAVTIDGCVFGYKSLPNTSMKLELLRGDYEGFERHAVRQFVRREYPVVELGGCIGVVSCITNRILDNPKAHVVVEANPLAIPNLQENKSLNNCGFEIINAAIAYDREAVTFSQTVDFMGNALQKLDGMDTVTVNSIQLGEIIRQHNIETYTLICDIEGHEYDLVRLDSESVKKAHTIILETHARLIGDAKAAVIINTLENMGFKKLAEESFVVVMGKVRRV